MKIIVWERYRNRERERERERDCGSSPYFMSVTLSLELPSADEPMENVK